MFWQLRKVYVRIRARLWRLRWKARRWWEALLVYMPCPCDRCRRQTLRKDLRLAQTTWGAWVNICPSCYAYLYGEVEGKGRGRGQGSTYD